MNSIRIRFDQNTAYTRDWLADNEAEAQRVLATSKARNITPHASAMTKCLLCTSLIGQDTFLHEILVPVHFILLSAHHLKWKLKTVGELHMKMM